MLETTLGLNTVGKELGKQVTQIDGTNSQINYWRRELTPTHLSCL